MTPTVGRIVHYLHASSDGPRNGADVSPAIVLQVWGEGEKPCINLGVFFADGRYEWRTSVVHEDDRYVEKEPQVPGSPIIGSAWRWPPRD